MIEKYSSVISSCIEGLIEQKRSNGFSYKGEAYMLIRFDALCSEYGLSEISLPKELVDLWSVQDNNENLNTRNHRVSLIRQLSKYMVSQGYQAYTPKIEGSWEKSIPHILSADELIALFEIIDNQVPNYKHPRRFIEEEKILFRLFYCCGLRQAEGRNLKRDAVHLEEGIIEILHSKGDKDRIVYLADDLCQMCESYSWYIYDECPESPWFFPGKDPMHTFSRSTLDVNFKRYWERTPFSKGGNKYPTIHALRHTFVVDRMNEWMSEGIDFKTMLPYLSRYLGHTSVDDTLYYYHLVDRAFRVVRQKDIQLANIIPEVLSYED